MEIIFLGTAASEGWPAVFCECINCHKARKAAGRNVRSRASVMLGEHYKVDLPPETLMQMQREGISMSEVRHLFLTHYHKDHIEPEQLLYKRYPFSQTSRAPLDVYGSATTIMKIEAAYELLKRCESPKYEKFSFENININLRIISPGKDFSAGDLQVMPLEADHAPDSLLFLFMYRGKVVLYGHDTGLFPDSTWKILSGFKLDFVIMDCTNGGLELSNRGHMGITGIAAVLDEMKKKNILRDTARIFATHFSHNGGLLHRSLENRLKPMGVEAAYDGLRVNL